MSTSYRVLVTVSAALLAVAGCASPPSAPWWADAPHYMVAADHAAASQAGAGILAAGGNAVDAAVATSFALAVVRPESCGLGGGGFMIVYRPGEAPVALDYRETAPAAVRVEDYLDQQGRPIPDKTRVGPWAVATPGTVKGLLLALERYGSGRLTREQVLAPAIRLARTPLPVDAHLRSAMQELADDCRRNPQYRKEFADLCGKFLKDGEPMAVGAGVDRGDMAVTLQAIARDGLDGFYAGAVAEAIVAEVRRRGGPLTKDDLANHEVRVLSPLHGRFGPYEIVTMPPPSSGGAVLIESLNVVSAATPPGTRFRTDDPAGAHLLVEAMKHAFAERAMLLGDRCPEVLADVERMVSVEHARQIERLIDRDHTKPPESYGRLTAAPDGGTSHFCVVDAAGIAVGCTETINLPFGSRILVPGTGVILNNEMDDFAVEVTTPNAFGLRQSARNIIRPRARPLSSMCPTIVLRDGKVQMIAGGSGGPRIISATLEALLNVLAGEMPVNEAVAAPRLHHQWSPDYVCLQRGISPTVLSGLLDRGHAVRWYPKDAGCVQAIHRTSTGWRGVCDPVKGGRPVGG